MSLDVAEGLAVQPSLCEVCVVVKHAEMCTATSLQQHVLCHDVLCDDFSSNKSPSGAIHM